MKNFETIIQTIVKESIKNIQFVRWGGLSSVKQEGYGESTFHAPPARHGIYAFPETAIESFLLSKGTFDNRRMIRLDQDKIKKDEDGYEYHSKYWKNKKIKEQLEKAHEENDNATIEKILDDPDSMYWAKRSKPKKFSYTGELWHHLTAHVKQNDVLKRHESWILTSYKTWLKAFQKEYSVIKTYKTTQGTGYSKDHLEVFIEKV